MGRPLFGSIPRSWDFFMSFHIVHYGWHLYVSYSTYKMLMQLLRSLWRLTEVTNICAHLLFKLSTRLRY